MPVISFEPGSSGAGRDHCATTPARLTYIALTVECDKTFQFKWHIDT